MQLDETQKELDKFGKRLVKVSRSNLTKKKKNASKKLYDSLGYTLKVSKNSFQFSFDAEDYAEFVDQGVKGVGGTKADGTAWKQKTVTTNKFKYTTKKPPAKVFDSWIVKRGIAPRNKKGQFTSRKSISFAIANSVYHTGLETTLFYSKPFDSAFKDLPENVVKSFGLDTENFLKASIKKNDKK